jgi:CelD/BcsL family acetyltransferase involved in cellulose biosynthesis
MGLKLRDTAVTQGHISPTKAELPYRRITRGAMKISVLRVAELDPALLRRWDQLQRTNPLLASPYFSPGFTQAAADVLPGVRVAVLEDEHGMSGFFPFQRRWGAGGPVGDYLSDHHGVIAAPGTTWNWLELLRGCGLAYWRFDHLCAQQRPQVAVQRASSPGLDLSGGFEAWRDARVAAGARRLGELPRKARKLAREVGPLRFDAHCKDPRVLDRVIAMKSAQCRRTGARDCFAPAWARSLVQRIAATDDPAFGGRLSTLSAGDQLVAAHFGMRSDRVWHWWFPVYDHAYAAYSPGSLLLLQVAEAAAAQGHRMLDLGKGDEAYKSSFADTSLPVLEGCVAREALATRLRALRKDTGRWLRSSPWAEPLRPVLRHLGRLQAMLAAAVPEMLQFAGDLAPRLA